MTDFLLRIFVKNHTHLEDPRVRAAIGSLAGWVGIGCNLILFVLKLAVGILTGSVSVTADAANNLSDASASVVTLLGFRLAEKPADTHHPYGHARAEYLSGLAVAVLILFLGLELGKSSLEQILQPAAITFSRTGTAVLALSIGAKLWLGLFYRKLGKKIGSQTLRAAAQDSSNDCLTTFGALTAGLLEHFCNLRVDGIFGLAIAGFILVSGWKTAKDTVSPLLGEDPDPALRQKILDRIRSQEKVLGYHDLMIHDYGPGQRYASIHVEMDSREDPMECREIMEELEWDCLRNWNVHLVIRHDPVLTDDPETNRLREKILSLLRQQDPRLTLHDFRMVQGKRHMNLIFHVPLPEDLRGQEQALRREVEETMQTQDGKVYHVSITYDSQVFNTGSQ